MKARQTVREITANILQAASNGIGLSELKGTPGSLHRRIALLMMDAGYINVIGKTRKFEGKHGGRAATILATKAEYMNPDTHATIINQIELMLSGKESPTIKVGLPPTTKAKEKITPKDLLRMVREVKETQDAHAKANKEVKELEGMLQEAYIQLEEVSALLGNKRETLRGSLPRTDGDVTFQFEDGDIYYVDFGVLTVKKINPIKL